MLYKISGRLKFNSQIFESGVILSAEHIEEMGPYFEKLREQGVIVEAPEAQEPNLEPLPIVDTQPPSQRRRRRKSEA